MNRVDRIVLDPVRTYACTRTARTGVRVTTSQLESTSSASKQRAHSVSIRVFQEFARFYLHQLFFSRGTFVDYRSFGLYDAFSYATEITGS